MRSWVSLFLFYSAGLVILTGLVLYIMPPGSVAYWTDWRLLGLGKDQWESIHILFGILMMVLAIWHLYLNWRPFKRYLGSTKVPSKPFVSLTLLTVILTALTIKDLPPASWLVSLQAHFKNSWPQPAVPPPIPHTELLPLEALVKRENLSLEETLRFLEAKGFKIPSSRMTLKELARLNKSSPADLYALIIRHKHSSSIRPGKGTAISHPSRRTLKEVCAFYGLDRRTCEEILKAHGVTPEWDRPLKEWTFSYGITPWDVVEWLQEHQK